MAVIASRLILTKASTFVAYQLAWHVTGSVTGRYYIGSPYGYNLITWDTSLKGMMYGVYGFAFVVEVIIIHIVLNAKRMNLRSISPIASVVFFLSFPAFTSWSIEVPCERLDLFGFGCSHSIKLFAPIILSSSPIYAIPSVVAAFILIKIYAKYFKANLENGNNS